MAQDPITQLNDLQTRWEPVLSVPTWYLRVIPELEAFSSDLKKEPTDIQEECKARLYNFFQEHLVNGDIALGAGIENMDRERKQIDTVVIHHTSNPPGMSAERLSAIELIRLYAPYFANPSTKEDEHLKGQPIFSGHEHGGKQVFWPYHWIVRRDGSTERFLKDSEIGWQAGNWDVNCRSVAIVLDNDYEHARPTSVELEAIAQVIRRHYKQVSFTGVVGHREITSKTSCPSDLFLSVAGRKGWKDELLMLLEQST